MNDQWIGKKVQQVSCSTPEFQKFIGRKGTVTNISIDENGSEHVQTDDNVWCPAEYMKLLDTV